MGTYKYGIVRYRTDISEPARAVGVVVISGRRFMFQFAPAHVNRGNAFEYYNNTRQPLVPLKYHPKNETHKVVPEQFWAYLRENEYQNDLYDELRERAASSAARLLKEVFDEAGCAGTAEAAGDE